MGPKLTPDRRRQMTRDALIDAAIEVFAEKGFHAASLDEIATGAGFSRGAIYSNFDDKGELLLAVNERYAGMLAHAQAEAIADAQAFGNADSDTDLFILGARNAIETAPELRSLILLEAELFLYAMRNPDFADRFLERRRAAIDIGARMIEEQLANFGMRSSVSTTDLALASDAVRRVMSEMVLIDPDNPDHYVEVLALGYRLMLPYVVPIEDDAAASG